LVRKEAKFFLGGGDAGMLLENTLHTTFILKERVGRVLIALNWLTICQLRITVRGNETQDYTKMITKN
jgi:hypothetical protein